ncbi:MAG: beta-hydroxyacyl-ACP dehydratase [Thermodesulfovibrionales bacterium]|nr:beta-hydroxyacyl-ACP dehydratase [Thermodesulfovibrionales bacterium]
MIDRIKEIKDNTIVGVKNVAMSEDFLEFHFPDRPVMPGVLLLEALVQLAGWFTLKKTDFTKWFLLQDITLCKFYSFALPGDQITLTVENINDTSFKGIGEVDGKKKVVAEFSGIVIDVEEVEDREQQKRRFETLIRQESWK